MQLIFFMQLNTVCLECMRKTLKNTTWKKGGISSHFWLIFWFCLLFFCLLSFVLLCVFFCVFSFVFCHVFFYLLYLILINNFFWSWYDGIKLLLINLQPKKINSLFKFIKLSAIHFFKNGMKLHLLVAVFPCNCQPGMFGHIEILGMLGNWAMKA